MASFSLQWRKSTTKDLRRIPREAVSRILAEVEKLAEQPLPHGSEKLTGSEHTYRIRIGDKSYATKQVRPVFVEEAAVPQAEFTERSLR